MQRNTHYIRPELLPNWTLTAPRDAGLDPLGNDADTLLVETAKEWGVPLISYEGITSTGINPKKGILRKAKAAGVRVMTPKEFYWQDEQREQLLSALFITRFREHALDYIDTSTNPEVMLNTFNHLEAYYRHVLYGDTLGHKEALPVKLEGIR